MVPDAKMPGPGSSAEEWNIWWRNWVMGELDRLNEGIENLKRQIAATDKATGIDIAILKTQAALYGAGAGSAVTLVMTTVFLYLDHKLF